MDATQKSLKVGLVETSMSLQDKMDQYEHIFEKNCFGHFSSTMKDGSSHVAPLWVIYNNEVGNFQVTIEEGSIKHKNILRDPRVCLSVSDPDNPYHYVQIRGDVTKIEEDIDEKYLNRLYKKYSNGKHEKFWGKYSSPILILTIEPRKITGWGRESAGSFLATILG